MSLGHAPSVWGLVTATSLLLGRIRTISKRKSGHDRLAPVSTAEGHLPLPPLPPLTLEYGSLLRNLQETPGISGGWLSARQPLLFPVVSLCVRWQGRIGPSPLRLQRGCTVRPVAPPSSHGGTVRSFPESPLEGLAWVSHHVTAWLGPRSHMRREPGLGTGSRLGGAEPRPTSWPWAGGAPPAAAASQPSLAPRAT